MGQSFLFGEQATIHDVVDTQRRALQKALEELPGEAVRGRSIDDLVTELVERFRLDVPVLDRSGIVQLPNEEVDVDVSHDPGRVFRNRGPHYVKGTAIRISIPFKGEEVLFRYGTSPFNNPIPGEVTDGAVVLTYSREYPDPAAVKADFDHRLGQLESTLQMVRGPAEEWNRQLPAAIRDPLERRRAKLERDGSLTLGYPVAPATPRPQAVPKPSAAPGDRHDLFLSHASEDKDAIARPLYAALVEAGAGVWFDEAVLELGDSLRRKIDDGLARCRYGVVILSPHFLEKDWPQRELDGLVARETSSGQKAILPIWHRLDRDTLLRYSPMLADRVAGRSEEGIPSLVTKIMRILRGAA